VVVYWRNSVPAYFDIINDKPAEIYLNEVVIEGSENPINFEIYSDIDNSGDFGFSDQLVATSQILTGNKSVAILSDQVLSAKRDISNSSAVGVINYLPKNNRFFIKIKNIEKIDDIKIKVTNALSGGEVKVKMQNINSDSYQHLSLNVIFYLLKKTGMVLVFLIFYLI